MPVYQLKTAQTIEVDGLTAEIDAGFSWESSEDIELEGVVIHPDYKALQIWWVEVQVKLCETHSQGDDILGKLGIAYRSILRELDLGQAHYGLDIDLDRIPQQRRCYVKWLAEGKIPQAYFLDVNDGLNTLEGALRALIERVEG